MENVSSDRRVKLYKLINYKSLLSRTRSFSDNIEKCNFTFYSGWGGKLYVNDNGHSVIEYRPVLRGVDLFNLYYLVPSDAAILTSDQYADYQRAKPARAVSK